MRPEANFNADEATARPGAGIGNSHSLLFWGVAAFWATTLLLGGAGADYPLIAMCLEILGTLLGVAIAFTILSEKKSFSSGVRAPAIIAGLMVLLPLMQLVPLPPALWEALPGRERAALIFATQGWKDQWMPLSLDPDATKLAALSLLPGLVMFFATGLLGLEERLKLASILVAFAMFSVALGAMQSATGGGFTLYETVHRGHALGLFTNRNHEATFLVIALLLGAAIAFNRTKRHERRAEMRWLAAGIGCLFVAGVLATRSRSGAAFLLLAIPVTIVLFGILRPRWRTLAGLFAAAAILLPALALTPAVQDLLGRFLSPDDDRYNFWVNTM